MAGETVLIIEDRRENIVHLANNVLKPNGYNVITAMDGQRGLNRILTDGPDLVILDLNMPKMDGLEVLAALKDRQVQIPVILTTFYGSEQVAQQVPQLKRLLEFRKKLVELRSEATRNPDALVELNQLLDSLGASE